MHSPKNDWSILNESEVTPWQNEWLWAAEKEENNSLANPPSQSVFTQAEAHHLRNEAPGPELLTFRAENRAPDEDEAASLPELEAGISDFAHSHALEAAGAETYLENLLPADISPAFSKPRSGSAAYSGLLSPEKNYQATRLNQKQVPKSGLSLADITAALDRYIDLPAIRQALAGHNRSQPAKPYQFHPTDIDAVFTEAVHQFQVATYLNPAEHDGILGASTLETLGFIRHQLKPAFNRNAWYGQQQLNQIKKEVSAATNGEFTAANWFDFMAKPAWLGIKITDGIHVLLLQKLRQAESWLLSQPAYKGLTPAALGKALGFDKAGISYSGARLSANKEAMHGFGLAIDINATGNPWIGAGWIRYDVEKLKERTRLLDILRKASAEKLPGDTIFAYLHSIAQTVGADTAAAYNVLKQRNDAFVDYLRNNPVELRYWRSSATFDTRDPLKGFLNLPADLVYALRQIAGLAWGAVDFGPRASGDIMHFDLRTSGVGKIIAGQIKAYIPQSGHPSLQSELAADSSGEWESHEAIEEATWEDPEEEEVFLAADQDLE
jgi:hypothetical protein